MRHWQVIWLLAKGWRTAEIAEAVGYSVVWIRKLCHRYGEGGPEAMQDGRRNNPGNPPMLDEAGQAELKQAIKTEPPPGDGEWDEPKTSEVLRQVSAPRSCSGRHPGSEALGHGRAAFM